MYNYKIEISYDGANYNGWQKQKNTKGAIQEELETVIFNTIQEKVEVIGSGRTDKGVHAIGQVANFITKKQYDVSKLKNDINNNLKNDICIVSLKEVNERFHSRYNAKSKTYVYKINNAEFLNPFTRKYSYHISEKLNISNMRKGANFLVGKKDFACFSTARNVKKNTVKTIEDIEIIKAGSQIIIKFKGTGFLYNQVRIMVGTLIDIGLNINKPSYIQEIFEKNERVFAGRKIPPHGLFLEKVEYVDK